MKNLFGIFTGILMIASGCSVQQDIRFNADYSGSMNIVIDMSALAELDETGSMMRDMKDSLDVSQTPEVLGMEGISNVKVSMDTTTWQVRYSFDFANPDALNRALSYQDNTLIPDTSGSGPKEVFSYFKVKGKKLIYSERPLKGEVPGAEVVSSEEAAEMDAMFMFSFNITVPKKIKKVKGADVSKSDDNTVSWTRKMSEFGGSEKPFSFTIAM
jgi:hypothetical protein